ncbi:MAG: outer membrane protein assembly factor BamD [Deltaproteobacteria bacterium]|nr:outer membrane protein assembly factor BamD [Deltaproteobacteria bacterium]
MKRLFCSCLICLYIFTGCGWFQTKEEKTSDELAADGMEYFEEGKYKKAIESFEKLKDWYPFSKYAILAELKIADAHFFLKEFEDAIFAYEEFESLHPRNEAIPYVIYQIGRSYFKQVDTIDRDQTATRKALDTFNRLIKNYPNSEYARKAWAYQTQCQKILAGHELYVGIFYYKAKHYEAALQRFRSIISNYPDVGVHQKALVYIAECEKAIRNMELEKKKASQEGNSKRFWKFW